MPVPNRPFSPLAALLATALFTAGAAAQDSHLTIEAKAVPAKVAPGGELTVEVAIDVEAGWHVYGALDDGVPTKLTFPKTGGLVAKGKPVIPPGDPHEHGGITNFWIEGAAVLKQTFTVPPDLAPGQHTIEGQLAYMACTPEFCDPPGKDTFKVTVTVEGAAGAPAGTQPAAGTTPEPKSTEPKPSTGPKPSTEPKPAQGPGTGVAKTGIAPGLDPFAPPPKIRLAPRFEPAVARPGEKVRLVVDVTVDEGWHVYGSASDNVPTRLVLRETGPLEVRGEAQVPPGELHDTAGITTHELTGTFAIEQTFVVPADAAPGEIGLQAGVDHMPCDESTCLDRGEVPFTATLRVEAGAPRPEHDAATAPPRIDGPKPADGGVGNVGNGGERVRGGGDVIPTRGEPVLRQPKFELDDIGGDMGGSLWNLILLCIGGGLIALVMPCTYPMIPITFSFFTKQADLRGGKVLPLALTYGAGIVAIFIAIGLMVGPVIIEFAAAWGTNLVIGAAFLFFAMTLFGWINLQPPQFLTQAAGKASATGGLLGVFLMGATLVVTSFTCTAPIVGSLLAGVAQGDVSQLDLAIGMGAFGLTMALPFVFLALLPGRVKALPKSGQWMQTLKVSLGFVELAAALKFFSNVDVVLDWKMLPRELFLGIWALVFVLLALYLFGLFRSRGEPITGVSTASNTIGIASMAFGFLCFAGVSGLRLGDIMTAFEPPYQIRPVEEHDIVKDDYEAAVAEAIREKKYLLVNFTGFT